MTDNQLAVVTEEKQIRRFSQEEREIIFRTVDADATQETMDLFMYVCETRGLNPMANQIHLVGRFSSKLGRKQFTIQTGIDGFRLIADRTGNYLPGRETEYRYDDEGNLVAAVVYLRKFRHGEWHEFPAKALWNEYKQTYNNQPVGLWKTMPLSQLEKCAEAKAFRKGWPEDFSGIYINEEMDQADNYDGNQTCTELEWIVKNGVKDSPFMTLRKALQFFKDSGTTHELFDGIYAEFNKRKAERNQMAQSEEPEVHEGEVEDTPDLSTDAQRKMLRGLAAKRYGSKDADTELHKLIENPDGTPRSTKDLTKVEISGLIETLQAQINNPPPDLNDRVREKMVDAKITNKVDALRAKARKLKEDITEEELLGQYNTWLGTINEQTVDSLEDSTVELLTMGAAMIGGSK